MTSDRKDLHRVRRFDAIQTLKNAFGTFTMELIHFIPFAAIEYSLIYMIGGGGLVGAIVIFVIAKMLRR